MSSGVRDDTTLVWIRTDVIESSLNNNKHGKDGSDAPGLSSEGRKRPQRRIPYPHQPKQQQQQQQQPPGDWGWVLGHTTGSRTSSHSNHHHCHHGGTTMVQVRVSDRSSPYYNQTINLPPEDGLAFVPANDDDDDTDDNDSPTHYPPHNLIHLTHLHEPAVVLSLSKRYAHDDIYTYTGAILLALNPFKRCPHLYSTKMMDRYRFQEQQPQQQQQQGSSSSPPLPHIYAIAARAFYDMMKNRTNPNTTTYDH